MSSRPLALSLVLLLAAFGLVFVACSADSPSEPSQNPGNPPPPGGGGTNASFGITIGLNPGEIPAGSDDPVLVRIEVRRLTDNQPPPNGTTAVVTATAGSFGEPETTSSATVVLTNGVALVNYFPPGQPGTVVFQARLEGSIGQATLVIREAATFFLASIDPNSGSPDGGETVTIQGGGFEQPVRVTFGSVPAQVLSVSSSRIRVRTPPSTSAVAPGTTQPVTVSVTNQLNTENQQFDSLTNGFIYARGGSIQQPQVFSLSPASGPNEGGTRVRIRGEGFVSPLQVFFGSGTAADNFQGTEAVVESVTANEIVVITPAATAFGQDNLNATVNVLVKNSNGFATVATSAFEYGSDVLITSIGPGAGPYTGGTVVTINGQGFDEPVAVTLGGVAQPVISVTGTQVVFRTAGVVVTECPDDGIVEAEGVSVTNIESGDSASADVIFEYLVPIPVITGVSPSEGGQTSRIPVTITGINFEEPVRVLFVDDADEYAGTVVSASPTQIVVNAPAVPNSLFDVEACDDNGDGTAGERYITTFVDLQVENLFTSCSDEFTGSFAFRPNDTSCRNDVGEEGAADGADGSTGVSGDPGGTT